MTLLAIDPGKRTGLAYWTLDGWKLETMDHTTAVAASYRWAGYDVVIEIPVIYPTTKNPNDVLGVAFQAGELAGAFGENNEIHLIPAPRWTKGVPKKIRHERLKRDHKDLKGSNHAWDAFGLALWWYSKEKS